jgi:hypothetical protein
MVEPDGIEPTTSAVRLSPDLIIGKFLEMSGVVKLLF